MLKKSYFTILALIMLIPMAVLAEGDAQKKQAYFFYSDKCSHCHVVDEYFKSNGIYEKYQITRIEVTNPFNAKLLMDFYEEYDYPENERGGVPAVAFEGNFMVGDKPIIDQFESEIAKVEAKALPETAKAGSGSDINNTQDQKTGGSNLAKSAGGDQQPEQNRTVVFVLSALAVVIVTLYLVRKKDEKGSK